MLVYSHNSYIYKCTRRSISSFIGKVQAGVLEHRCSSGIVMWVVNTSHLDKDCKTGSLIGIPVHFPKNDQLPMAVCL
jgi:hypothetical protein